MEFFRRTYLTDSLKRLLTGAVQRLSGEGGNPPPSELVGIDAVLAEAGVSKLPKVSRVVLVGNKVSPGNPTVKADGTVVRTLWGELAWQLGYAAGGAKGPNARLKSNENSSFR